MADALDIRALLAELGYAGTSGVRARQALEEARLTHGGKTRIDLAKRPRIEALLEERFHLTCGQPECDRAATGREVLHADDRAHCRVCAGSSNRRAFQTAEDAFKRHGIRRVVVVGGSPAVHDALRAEAPATWELRLVDGTVRRTSELARADLKWADLILVWGSSELDHKVSTLYTHTRDPRVVTVSRRGIAALLEAAVKHAQGQGRRDV